MNFLTILLIIVIVIVVFIIIMAVRKIKNQDNDITRLIKEGSIASNNLRLKGIKVDQLEKENEKLKDVG